MQKKDCAGCRDDFYNGHNPLGVSVCWHFDRTKALETRYRLSVHTPMKHQECVPQGASTALLRHGRIHPL